MNQDDLPPRPLPNDTGFASELGGTFATALWIGTFLVIAGVVLFFIMRWSGHSPCRPTGGRLEQSAFKLNRFSLRCHSRVGGNPGLAASDSGCPPARA